MKRLVSSCLLLAILLGGFHPVAAFAKEKSVGEITPDTVVCYMYGEPIRKKDVLDNGMIIPSKISSIEKKLNSKEVYFIDSKAQNLNANKMTRRGMMPSYAKNCIITSQLSTRGFHQDDTAFYFTATDGAKFASESESSVLAQITEALIGYRFSTEMGAVLSTAILIKNLRKNETIKQIRARTDVGKRVHINCSSTSYGVFYGVFDWGGKYIDIPTTFNDGTTVQKLVGIAYK